MLYTWNSQYCKSTTLKKRNSPPFFLATPVACESSQATDGTWAIAVATLDPQPLGHRKL